MTYTCVYTHVYTCINTYTIVYTGRHTIQTHTRRDLVKRPNNKTTKEKKRCRLFLDSGCGCCKKYTCVYTLELCFLLTPIVFLAVGREVAMSKHRLSDGVMMDGFYLKGTNGQVLSLTIKSAFSGLSLLENQWYSSLYFKVPVLAVGLLIKVKMRLS